MDDMDDQCPGGLPEPFQAEYNPQLYSAAHPQYQTRHPPLVAGSTRQRAPTQQNVRASESSNFGNSIQALRQRMRELKAQINYEGPSRASAPCPQAAPELPGILPLSQSRSRTPELPGIPLLTQSRQGYRTEPSYQQVAGPSSDSCASPLQSPRPVESFGEKFKATKQRLIDLKAQLQDTGQSTSQCIPSSSHVESPQLQKFRAEKRIRDFKMATQQDEYKGTQGQIDKARLVYGEEFDPEQYMIDSIPAYAGTVEVYDETPTVGLRGLMKQPSTTQGQKKQLLLNRKTEEITIPCELRRPDERGKPLPTTYMYRPGHSMYNVGEGELLPPRDIPRSPTKQYGRHGTPRSMERLQQQRAQETDRQRRQDFVPSREPRQLMESYFGNLEAEQYVMPRSYWRKKKQCPITFEEMYRMKRERKNR